MPRDYLETMGRRECVAYVYTKDDAERAASGLPRVAAAEMPMTIERARELLPLGATWVGTEACRP